MNVSPPSIIAIMINMALKMGKLGVSFFNFNLILLDRRKHLSSQWSTLQRLCPYCCWSKCSTTSIWQYARWKKGFLRIGLTDPFNISRYFSSMHALPKAMLQDCHPEETRRFSLTSERKRFGRYAKTNVTSRKLWRYCF